MFSFIQIVHTEDMGDYIPERFRTKRLHPVRAERADGSVSCQTAFTERL